MIDIVKQNRLESLACACWLIAAVAFLIDGNYLMSLLSALLFVGNFIQLYGKVKKSKEYDND